MDCVLKRLQLYYLGVSLGGVESLVCYPETMSHASMTPEARRRAGISERTIRVSVGIEDPEDLVAICGRRSSDFGFSILD